MKIKYSQGSQKQSCNVQPLWELSLSSLHNPWSSMDEAEIQLGSLSIPQTKCPTLSDVLVGWFVAPAQLGLISKPGFMIWHLSPDYPEVQGWGSAVTSASGKVSFPFIKAMEMILGYLAIQKSQGKADKVIPPWYPILLGDSRRICLMGSPTAEASCNSMNCSNFHRFPLKNTSISSPVFSLLKAGSQVSNWVKISVLPEWLFFNLKTFLFMWCFTFQGKCILKATYV